MNFSFRHNLRGRGLMAPLRQIITLAVPAIITNITTPLLALVDLAIVGHMGGPGGSAAYIAAIAVGGSVFNMLYWLFGFLRMGTSGPAAQAVGAADTLRLSLILYRALAVALAISLLIVIFNRPLSLLLLAFIDPDPATFPLALRYVRICIFGAPAVLSTYVLTGWFLGRQDSRSSMWVSLAINVVNILSSLILVYGLRLGITGVAAGTLIAQWFGFIMAAIICMLRYRPALPPLSLLIRLDELRRFFSVNTDIFLRTLCIIAVTVWFTRAGAAQGDLMLAVNALIMQLFTIFSFFLDGFAFAGESLCGLYSGQRDHARLRLIIRLLLGVTATLALIFSTLYFLFGQTLLTLLSSDSGVISATADYLPWAITIPLLSFVAFTYDAVCLGTTRTRLMLLSCFLSAAIFFTIYFTLFTILANHALWLAFVAYLAARGLILHILLRPHA